MLLRFNIKKITYTLLWVTRYSKQLIVSVLRKNIPK